ncbi:MAG: flavin reductase [Rhodospirillaceae bacterium]|nr:flavin reductase [Rhodospirillaceae bacterium]
MPPDLSYKWPYSALEAASGWEAGGDTPFRQRDLPETPRQLAHDSRWPAFFPSPICFVTTANGEEIAFEKVVGPSIVNRFPYIAALSFCREELSDRHHVRGRFAELLESGGSVAIQFLPQGDQLVRAMKAIAEISENRTSERLAIAGLETRSAKTVDAPILKDAYLVYEGKLVKPGKDFSGDPIYDKPWSDVGSHRVYFIEITAIQLREDIAQGKSQISWGGLPEWKPDPSLPSATGVSPKSGMAEHYQKGYTPRYKFPAANTVAFESDDHAHGMAIKHLAALPQDQIEVDNDRARWPCFFPSPTAMITTWTSDKQANLMPCGSTTIISRHPLIIAPCISYSAINERYGPRASLDIIRQAGSFGCGVAYIDENLTKAIRYSGTTSFTDDPDKIANAGLSVSPRARAPQLNESPIHFECDVVGEIRLGTHIMFLGEVKSILVRQDLTPDTPMTWSPWADIKEADGAPSPANGAPL